MEKWNDGLTQADEERIVSIFKFWMKKDFTARPSPHYPKLACFIIPLFQYSNIPM
jgi:hypothetical protein